MKREILIILLMALLCVGCGMRETNELTESGTHSEFISETGTVHDSESSSEIDSDPLTTEIPSETESATTETETQDTEIVDTQNPERPMEPETPAFQITLPEGAALMGDVFGGGDWIIRREGYVVTEEYPYEGRFEAATQAGWITLWEGEYWGGETPGIPWNNCEYWNYTKLKQGYLCEAYFEVYDALDIYDQNIPDDKCTAECWVLVFEDPKGMQETGIHSNWIFLSKKCFTKEEALEIAKTYVPAYTE